MLAITFPATIAGDYLAGARITTMQVTTDFRTELAKMHNVLEAAVVFAGKDYRDAEAMLKEAKAKLEEAIKQRDRVKEFRKNLERDLGKVADLLEQPEEHYNPPKTVLSPEHQEMLEKEIKEAQIPL